LRNTGSSKKGLVSGVVTKVGATETTLTLEYKLDRLRLGKALSTDFAGIGFQ
jgi:hypothetical protein